MAEIGRLLTAMVTPFGERGRVDYDLAGRLANTLLDYGSDGIVVAGTTGESPVLSMYEHAKLIRVVKAAVGSRGCVVAGAGTNSSEESIKLVRDAETAHADAVLLVVPYYNKPDQRGLYEHFAVIAASTKLPCILYNVPSRTVVNLDVGTTLRLAQIPNIIGIKEASGDMEQVTQIIAGVPEGFRVWSGNDDDTLKIVRLGGYGVVGVVTHIVGVQVKRMIEAELSGDSEAAEEIDERLRPLVRACFLKSNPVPIKYILDQLGLGVGKPRLPLVEPEEDVAQQIMGEVGKHKLDLVA